MSIKAVQMVTAGSISSLPPRKKAVTERVVALLKAKGIEVEFKGSFETLTELQMDKPRSILALAKIVGTEFTSHGPGHGSKGFMLYHFSDNGKSPFSICGYDSSSELTIAMPTSRWTSRTADLPELSILAVRQNLEALTGVKLKPVLRRSTGSLSLVGMINGKNGGSREEVLNALAKAGKKKTVPINRMRNDSKVTFEKTAIYLPKLEATGLVTKVGGPGGPGGYQLVIS